MEGSEVSTSGVKCRWVKCSEGLSNGVSNIIRSYKVCCLYGFFVYHILSCSLGSIFYHCIYGCMVRVLLFNFVNYVFCWYVYVFLLLCVFCSTYSVFTVLFYVLFVCKCVLYYCHRVSTQLQSYFITCYGTAGYKHSMHGISKQLPFNYYQTTQTKFYYF